MKERNDMQTPLKPLFEPEPMNDQESSIVSWDTWGTKGFEMISIEDTLEDMLDLSPEAQEVFDTLGFDLLLDAIHKMRHPETSNAELDAWIARERRKLEEIQTALIPVLQRLRDKGFTFGPDYWEKADEADPIPKIAAEELPELWIEPLARILIGQAPPEALVLLADFAKRCTPKGMPAREPFRDLWRLRDTGEEVAPFERRSAGLRGLLMMDEILEWAMAHRDRLTEILDRRAPSYEEVHLKVTSWLRSLQRHRFALPGERMTANDIFFFALPALLRESCDRLLRTIFRPDLKPGSVKLSETGQSLLPWIANAVPGARGAALRLFGSIPQPSKEDEWGTFFGIADPRKSPGLARMLGIQIGTAWAEMTGQPVGLAIWRCRNGSPPREDQDTGRERPRRQ
ncbi:MAG: hypothetical protein HYT87_14720 [Nitrospirae bacterium]|nr:hypothetical protein [Nitrospirota bacterium]